MRGRPPSYLSPRAAAGRTSQRLSVRPAAGMTRHAAGCLLLLCCALPLGSARAALPRTPSFGGRVAENRPAGTRVEGLSVPLTRLGALPWCAQVRGRRWRLQLLGEGHAHFQAALQARTARVWLRTRRPLDREARPLYSLRLALRCARRSAAPAEPLAALTVRVLDANDNAPRFVGARPARLRLDETLPLGSAVWRARAEDADADANAELRYFARPPSEHFFVVPRSGSVLLVRSLLHLRAPIPLRLYARDRGRPALLSAPLELEVLPQAKRMPPAPGPAGGPQRRRRTPPLSLSSPLPEDARPGRPPGRFEPAAPAIEESALPVETESGVARPAARVHGPGTAGGERLGRVLERQGKDQYLLHLVALTVADANDNVPEWAMEPFPFLAVVSPQAAEGTQVYKLLAVDADEGIHGTVEYFLLEGGEARFEVERNTGWIKTTGLPLVRSKEYLLTVLAADKLGNKGSPASVSIIAGFRPPQFSNMSYFVHVPESMPQGKSFLRVTAISYQNKSLNYSLLTNPSGLFSIGQSTGDISLTRNVDYESDQHQYLLLVRAEENEEQLSSAAEVSVVITDVNDCSPEFHQSIYSKVSVPETVTMTTALLQVTATDCDSKENAEILYYSLSPDFTITSHGTIFPATKLDYERPNHLYEFTIMAVDKGEEMKTGTATVRIHISNVNDEALEFSQTIYRSFVSEDAGPNTLVATVNAVDPDGDGVNYDILSGSQKGNFVIDPKKGLVRLHSSPFPKLHGTEYILNVIATDDNASGGTCFLTSTAQVIVKIDDVNNNKRVFQKCQYYREHASVLENQPSETVVLQVEATDADEGANGIVKYGLMHRDGILPAFSMHPDTDVNDNVPFFTSSVYESSVAEGTDVGTFVIKVSATDLDLGQNGEIIYLLLHDRSRDYTCFRLDSQTGSIYTTSISDREKKRSYLLEVKSVDGSESARPGKHGRPNSDTPYVCIFITDVNDNKHVFSQHVYEVNVDEDQDVVSPIITVSAKYEDEGTNAKLCYQITAGSTGGELDTEAETGTIFVAQPLDYEETKIHEIHLLASDGKWEDYAVTIINVMSKNDESPVFSINEYYGSIIEELDGLPVFVL